MAHRHSLIHKENKMAELPIRKKKALVSSMAIFLFENGLAKDIEQYRHMKDAPLSIQAIKKYFGRWPRLLKAIETQEPTLWAEILKAEEKKVSPAPKPAVSKVEPELKAEKPKATVKPATAVKTGK